ncbi:MAG TPA: hypothetical protein EYQ27_13540 [Gemmatimonadetes bacterium]|nr:hypothetical protein [Gemmatimonadota bacterium]
MSRRTREERDAQIMHEVTSRAIRRLDVLEWVILVAWLIAPTIEPGFRPTWAVTSMLLFIVPGLIALIRMRRDKRDDRSNTQSKDEENDG